MRRPRPAAVHGPSEQVLNHRVFLRPFDTRAEHSVPLDLLIQLFGALSRLVDSGREAQSVMGERFMVRGSLNDIRALQQKVGRQTWGRCWRPMPDSSNRGLRGSTWGQDHPRPARQALAGCAPGLKDRFGLTSLLKVKGDPVSVSNKAGRSRPSLHQWRRAARTSYRHKPSGKQRAETSCDGQVELDHCLQSPSLSAVFSIPCQPVPFPST